MMVRIKGLTAMQWQISSSLAARSGRSVQLGGALWPPTRTNLPEGKKPTAVAKMSMHAPPILARVRVAMLVRSKNYGTYLNSEDRDVVHGRLAARQ